MAILKRLPPPSTTAVAPNQHAAVAADQARINAALAQPGATGMKGFLIWVKAAWPAPIADKIIAAAGAELKKSAAVFAASPMGTANARMKAGIGFAPRIGAMSGMGRYNRAGRVRGIGTAPGMGGFGQSTSLVPSSDIFAPINIASGSGSSSSTIAATPSSSAPSSWLSSIGSIISGVTQGYLGLQQSKDAQTLFNTNLQRAQQGLSPLNANPSAYGIIAPGINVGLSSSTESLVMYAAIGAGVLGVGYLILKASKK